jgi:predicted ester cyclase
MTARLDFAIIAVSKEIESTTNTRNALSAEPTNSLIRRMLEHAFNQGALAVVDELLAPDAVTHIPSWGMPHTREGLKQLIALFRSAFPDLQCTVEEEISTGDRVAAHWVMRGTQIGLFLGNRPSVDCGSGDDLRAYPKRPYR